MQLLTSPSNLVTTTRGIDKTGSNCEQVVRAEHNNLACVVDARYVGTWLLQYELLCKFASPIVSIPQHFPSSEGLRTRMSLGIPFLSLRHYVAQS